MGTTRLFEFDGLHVDVFVKEDESAFLEFLRILCGQVAAGSPFRASMLHLGMATEVVGKAVGNIFALGDDFDAAGHVFQDFIQQQRVMGASEDDGVNLGIGHEELVNALLDKIVGSGRVHLVVFYQWHPEGACHAADSDVRGELLYFELIALALDGSLGGEDAHMSRLGKLTDDFRRGADDAENPF